MEKEYNTFTVRRLFVEDLPLIEKYSQYYDHLFFNPVSRELLPDIFLNGAFWAVFDGQIPVAVTYILAADSSCFSDTGAGWHLADLLGETVSHCLLCGYLWTDDKYSGTDFYTPVVKLWLMQADRRNKNILVHFVLAQMKTDFESLFYNGFQLMALRGLDNLVPHWLFARNTEIETDRIPAYEDVKTCPLSDTKELSRLCEKGYRAFDMDVDKNLLFRR